MNSLAASQSGGRVSSLVTPEDKLAMNVEDPLAVVAGNHFEGKFTDQPSETSLNYINLPRGRRIVPVDALSWVAAFNAGYEPRLDCTAVSGKIVLHLSVGIERQSVGIHPKSVGIHPIHPK